MINLDILEEVYNSAGTESFVTLYELEIKTGRSGFELRNILEDLKEAQMITEHPEGYQISSSGIHFCRTKWV